MALTKNEREILRQAAEIILGHTENDGDGVKITGFGTFRRKLRAARSARNPQTGETVQVPARSVLKFTPARDLTEER